MDEISWTERIGNEWLRLSAEIAKIDYDGNVGHALVSYTNECVARDGRETTELLRP
mgnify:CR=1 FL=1